METKPGFKTSEFWLKLAATVVGALLGSGIFVMSENVWLKGIGAFLAVASTVLGSMGYSDQRFALKQSALQLNALAMSLQADVAKAQLAAKPAEAKAEVPFAPSPSK